MLSWVGVRPLDTAEMNFDVVMPLRDETKQSSNGEPLATPAAQRRDLRLMQAKERRGQVLIVAVDDSAQLLDEQLTKHVVDPHARIIHCARAESRMICVHDGPLSRGLGDTSCPRRHPLLQGVE